MRGLLKNVDGESPSLLPGEEKEFQILSPSCYLRYANYSFIEQPPAPPLPVTAATATAAAAIRHVDFYFTWQVPLQILALLNHPVRQICRSIPPFKHRIGIEIRTNSCEIISCNSNMGSMQLLQSIPSLKRGVS